jgi:hypothetical protein
VVPELHGAGQPRATPASKAHGIPKRETLWIIERRLEDPQLASRKWLADQTREREDLTYVPRDRLAPLVDWIDEHPEAARSAVRLRRTPPSFSAGPLGPIPPRRPDSA